jgi:23S rRNA (cytidine1920-2'-O)/16S rRNA (cytidine1409-2'-O)-methyltransferase
MEREEKKKQLPLLEIALLRHPQFSRDELYARIMCGDVRVNGAVERNPKRRLAADLPVEISERRYVSRGGEKLESAYRVWHFPVQDKTFVDAGASTGGFTHFLLLHGASCVHSVDVGYNQLDYSLRADPRVRSHERTNIFDIEELDPRPHAAVGDLSFRSLRGAASHILSLTYEGWGIFLLKPQFELRNPGREFSGVVTDMKEQQSAVEETLFALAEEGVRTQGIIPSAIRGRKGNQEYLVYLLQDANEAQVLKDKVLQLSKNLFLN